MPNTDEIEAFLKNLEFERQIDCDQKSIEKSPPSSTPKLIKYKVITRMKDIFPQKHENESENDYKKRLREYKNNYHKQRIQCSCGALISLGSYEFHKKTSKHLNPNYRPYKGTWAQQITTCECGFILKKGGLHIHRLSQYHNNKLLEKVSQNLTK